MLLNYISSEGVSKQPQEHLPLHFPPAFTCAVHIFLPLQLEVELVQKEEKLLETDIIYQHIARLTDRIRATAENGKQGTLLLATRVRRACSAHWPIGNQILPGQ